MLPRPNITGHVDNERAFQRAQRRARALQHMETERERQVARLTLLGIWTIVGALAASAVIWAVTP
jgi:hypothetical protein